MKGGVGVQRRAGGEAFCHAAHLREARLSAPPHDGYGREPIQQQAAAAAGRVRHKSSSSGTPEPPAPPLPPVLRPEEDLLVESVLA